MGALRAHVLFPPTNIESFRFVRMQLHLSRKSTTSTILSATSPEDSDVMTPLYHIYTPRKLTERVTTISHISPSIAHDPSFHFFSRKREDIKESEHYRGGIQEFAKVQLKSFGSSTVEYEGRTTKVNDLMPPTGLSRK